MIAFDPESLDRFRTAYPEQPVTIEHRLVDHPLLTLEALAGLATRIRAVDVEYNRGDVPIGLDPTLTPSNGLSIADTVRSIESCGSWMVLKFIEQDAVYRDLLHSTLAEIDPLIQPKTGPMLKVEGFIFLSSPGAVTPFHFDPEHNILIQIRGQKVMTVFPADDEQLVAGSAHETFHKGGHRNLPWQDSFASKGEKVELVPGRALYVPVKAPHWVQNGPEVSISLSVTWRSHWSYREAYARQMNRLLRRTGIRPASPKRFPHQNYLKAFGYRAIEKARRVSGLEE